MNKTTLAAGLVAIAFVVIAFTPTAVADDGGDRQTCVTGGTACFCVSNWQNCPDHEPLWGDQGCTATVGLARSSPLIGVLCGPQIVDLNP